MKIESKWEIFKLNQLVSIVRGASPRPIREFNTTDVNGVNWIKIGDVKPDSKYITETKEKITIEGANKSRFVKKGDFILSNSMSFGRPYIMNIEGCIHDGWLLLSDFSENLNKDYLYYMLSDNLIQEQFISAASGGTSVDNLNIDKVAYTQIPLPPLEIQQKIVSEIEVLEVKEKKAKEEVEKQKEILEKTFKETVFNKFTKIKIGQLAQTSSGGTPLRTKSEYYENPTIPWLNSGEVRQGNIYKAENYISEIALKETSAKLFPVNSVLVAMYGATGGQVGILRFESTTNQAICGIFPNEKYLPEFLYYHLKFQYDDLLSARTGVARDNLSQEKIKNFEIFLPPLSEQQKIVSEIEKIEEQIKALETEIAEIPKQKEAILKKYL